MRLLKILCLAILLVEVLAHMGVQARQTAPAAQPSRLPLNDPTHPEAKSQFTSKPNDEAAARAPTSKRSARKDVAPAQPQAEPRSIRDKQIGNAYRDALSIVAADNACSQFFGGSYAAATVLAELAGQLHRTKLDMGIGIRMSGRETTIISRAHQLQYRLFERAEVNLAGPFSTHQHFPSEAHVPSVGSFQPDTREARALMLLHEIGHLIVGPDGAWLLPDDGHNEAQSNANTHLIEAKCGAQIRALHER